MMCGIAGWVRHAEGGRDPSAEALGATLRHRGPDEEGLIDLDRAQLICRRLALLDLGGGHQPRAAARGRFWSVFNGEIYNHAELRRELTARGHDIRGHGDSELIPHLYEQWGASFVERLRGMFALAVYDRHADELFLARDPFGIKPLLLLRTPRHVLFASEARTVMAAVGRLDIDPTSLWHYLSFGYVPDPATLWRDLVKLPPGHHATIRDGEIRISRYWWPRMTPGPDRSLRTSAEDVEAALQDSVAAHMAADVPVGAYLSSGVDSSVVTALAARLAPLKTFSIGFEMTMGANDEVPAARDLAARLGTEHAEEVITERDYVEALPQIVAAQESPLADPSAPALWFLARAASRQVKAVLSGEGADELFAGYPIFQQPQALRVFEGIPAFLRPVLGGLADQLPDGTKGKGYLQRGMTQLERRFLGNNPVFDDQQKRRLLAPVFAEGAEPQPSYHLVAPVYAASAGQPDVVRMQEVALQTWLPSSILAKADMMGMAHSLEVRVPFLDPEVYAVAASLPLHHRVAGGRTKVALREAAARLLPARTASRPKLGFPVPFEAWLEGGLGAWLRELAADCPGSLLDRREVGRVLTNRSHPNRHQQQLALLVFLLWHRSFVDEAACGKDFVRRESSREPV
ncbi:MAG TPA: asparagine synthase (glutamine-hydrolyzing) [Streptosporangiaceae bacterium]|nr:asparagine synthase (glutamine-hydrolyzing) [Streptosporangiaceae bacterium]